MQQPACVYSYCNAMSRFSREARTAGSQAAIMITMIATIEQLTSSQGCSVNFTACPKSGPVQRFVV